VGRPTALALMIAAALAAGVHGSAHAAGLGRLSVQSALGQPLDARVEITALTASELESLSARLAPVEAFRQVGIEPNSALSSFRFAIERRPDGRAFVRIASDLPITEPFVDLLVELNWAAGRFIREYTFLLDPPDGRFAPRPVGNGPALPQEEPAAALPGQFPAAASPEQLPAAAPLEKDPAAAPRGNGSRLPPGIHIPVPSGVLSVQPAASPPALPLPAVQPGSAAPALMEGAATAASSLPGQGPAGSFGPATGGQQAPANARRASAVPQGPDRASGAAAMHQMSAAATTAPGVLPAADRSVASRVTVRRGESLASIAKRVKPADISVEQAVIALYDANPGAFFGTVHQLRAGRTLEIPGRLAMASLSTAEARRRIASQADDYESYRQRLAEAAGRTGLAESEPSPNDAIAASKASAVGETRDAGELVAAPAEEATKAGLRDSKVQETAWKTVEATVSPAGGDRLRLSADIPETAKGAGAGKGTDSGQPAGSEQAPNGGQAEQAGLARAKETDAQRLAETEGAYAASAVLRDQQERLALLEESVAKLQRLVEQKNQQLAELERQVEASGAGAPGAGGSTGAGARVDATETGTTPGGARSTAIGLGRAALAVGLPSANAAAAQSSAQSSADAAPTGAPGSVNTLVGHPLAFPGLALAFALGAFTWYSRRRKGPPQDREDRSAYRDAPEADSLYEPPDEPARALSGQVTPDSASEGRAAGTTGTEGVTGVAAHSSAHIRADAHAGVVGASTAAAAHGPLANASPRSVERAELTEESALADHVPADVHVSEVDPLDEAEVYLAYGRESQAEEILREALEREPERHDVRVVLLEIYAEREDRTAFALLAREMHALTGGKNEEWWQVAAMGRVLDPDNRLYVQEGTPSASGAVAGADRSGDTRSALERAIDGRFDLPSLDLDADPAKDEPPGDSSLTEASDFRLDLPPLDEIDPGKAAAVRSASSPAVTARAIARRELDDAALDIASLDFVAAQSRSRQWQEMDAKLELAEAYGASGDKTGARELLTEVARGGDDEQRSRAQALLATLR
jgi:pilus assembly protein FimV